MVNIPGISSGDTSISKSKQLDSAVPASTIAALSSGEFVGSVADTPKQKIILKAFHAEIINDFDAIQKEEEAYKPIPVIRPVNNEMVQNNYMQIRQDVRDIIEGETNRLMNDPALAHLVIRKKQ